MAQADGFVSNGSGAAVRADINNQLAALFSTHSGPTEPTTTYAYQPWADTINGVLKIRNSSNSGWVILQRLDGTFDGLTLNSGNALLKSEGQIRFADNDSSHYVALRGASNIPANVIWTLPTADGTSRQVLSTSGSGSLTFEPLGVPAGAVQFFAYNTAPTGWLKANGAIISRSTYADLFAAIGTTFGAGDGSTTFALPDLRGEFPRAWDDGRGVDTSRTFGSAQAQSYQSHNHGISDPGHAHGVYDPGHGHGVSDPSHRHAIQGGLNAGGGSQNTVGSGNISRTGYTDYSTTGISINGSGTGIGIYGSGTGISIQNNGSTETRPRNIALLACIKF